MRKFIIVFLFSILLIGCSQQLPTKQMEQITKEEAEKIAIETALAEGYSDPELLTHYGTKTRKAFRYSVQEDKDVEVWEVSLLTSEREYVEGNLDLVYFINIINGDIVDKISGVG